MSRVAVFNVRTKQIIATSTEDEADYGTFLVKTLIATDVPDGTAYDIAYINEQGELGHLASYVMPDTLEVNGVRYEYQDSAEAYMPVLRQ